MNILFVNGAIFVMTFFQWVQMSSQMGTNYIHSLYVDNDEKYHLSWKFDEKEIVFEVVVNTTGYVVFGLSPDGTMANADIVIGELNVGQYPLKDYHAFGNGTLVKDAVANWDLLSTVEMNNQTKWTFKRKLITNDPNDMDITSNTMRVIWAYGDGNFKKENFTVGGYKSLHLLQAARPNVLIPADAEKLIIAMNETLVPNGTTTYLCKDIEPPNYKQKMHVIKISPIVTKGNELMVHHMILYICKETGLKRKTEGSYLCYEGRDHYCGSVLFGWAIGGSDALLPEHVGIPLGVSTDPVTFKLEIHYDNPEKKSGVLDSSGFELILTPARRDFDAAVLQTGHMISSDLAQKIPPYQAHFKSNSVCLSNCIYDEYPPKNKSVVMKIFAVLLHAHLIGTQIVLHHFRDGKELANIASDRNYDFNYQEMVFLNKEVEILRGDDLKVECVYNSMARSKFTWGGLSTTDEMCLAYIMYYPKMRIASCLSAIIVNDITWMANHLNSANLLQFKNQEFAQKFEQTVNGVGKNSTLYTFCSDGYNRASHFYPAENFLSILQDETPVTTDTPISTIDTPISTTDATSKAGIGVVTLFRHSLRVLLLVGLLLYLAVL